MGDPVVWLLDSGCGNHITRNPSLFRNLKPVPFLATFLTANGSALKATHIGNIGSPSDRLFLPDAFLVPELKCNLVSVGQLCNQGARLMFSSSGCIIEDSTGQVVGRGHKVGNHFILDELNMACPEVLFGTWTERRLQMFWAMPNASRNWAQTDEASSSSSRQLTASSNNVKELKKRATNAENVPIQALKVPKLEYALRWIESELMDDRVEMPDDDLFLIDLEVYQHTLWTLADNQK